MTRRALRPLPYLLILVIVSLGLTQITHASITFDEGPHLAIGYTTLRTGDFRLQPIHIHPPLANVLAGAPLLLQHDLPDPRSIDGWEINSLSAITDGVVWQYPHPRRIATAGRVPILLLNVLLGALVFRWARELGGWWAGTLALALYTFDPNFAAHGSLITTDVAAVLFIIGTLYTTARWMQTAANGPSWRFLAWTGLLLGLAQLTKVSGLMLVPVVGLLILVEAARTERRPLPILLRALRNGAPVLLLAALVVWAGYGFEIRRVPGWPIRVPAGTHLTVFQSLREHYDLGHATFALGRVSEQGWWWYFPVAFMLKTPLPTLLLAAITAFTGVVRLWYKRPPTIKTDQRLALLIFPLLYAAASLFSSVNIGYRHLLPILPFLFIGTGVTFGAVTTITKRLALTLAVGWLAASTLSTLPYPLTFFNILAGGPKGGYRYLVDSNLDWGQTLWDLKTWMVAHDEKRITYAHYSPARPATYGIGADFLPPDPRAIDFTPWRPAPGLYALGATVLQGPYAPDINTYAWFRGRDPTAKLGNALFIYRVPARTPPGWIVLCTPQDLDIVRQRLGLPDLRAIPLDCAETLVYPQSGDAEPGLYLTDAQVERPANAIPEIAFRTAEGVIAETLYSVAGPPFPEHLDTATAAIDGPLSFLGTTLTTSGSDPVVHTYWRVDAVPDRPLSLMAHLIGPDGVTAAVGDGMGFPVEQWRPGDVIVQRHPLARESGAPAGVYRVRVGAYWLDTMERWPVQDAQHQPNDAILLKGLRLPERR